MKKSHILLSLFVAINCCAFGKSYTNTFYVKDNDVNEGYFTARIWLDSYAMPKITVDGAEYIPISGMEGVKYAVSDGVQVSIGKERKRPFAVVSMPAYKLVQGVSQRLSTISLAIEEEDVETDPAKFRTTKTTASPSPLASGKWFKVSVPSTGFYRVDYSFVNSNMGLSNLNSAHVRVFGNGGKMLPESNAVPHKIGLNETAIWMNDGGDGNFGPGDYFIFYAQGPTGWQIDSATKTFKHSTHLYDNKAYYFLNFDQGAGMRVETQGSVPQGNVTVTSFNDYAVHEQELNNPGKMGKRWWGEEFSAKNNTTTYSIPLNIGGGISEMTYKVMLGSRGNSEANRFSVTMNGQPIANVIMPRSYADEDAIPVSENLVTGTVPFNESSATFNLTYIPAMQDALGYLDYIELNARKSLAINDVQLSFRDWNSVAPGNIATYQLANANAATQVWDVTDLNTPVRMNGALNGSTYLFTQDAATLHEFAALNGTSLASPAYIGGVDNQDLYGSEQVDYIIISPAAFLPAAQRLADFHRQRKGMKVIVATPQQVYNEFSSGAQDISAIRDFARLFYMRAGTDTTQMPDNLLLLGDASYDYKDRIANNTNFVPVYENGLYASALFIYGSDDFYSFLDDNEDIANLDLINTMDIGVGRLPVKSAQEADAVVNKVLYYKSPASLGSWRLATTIIADDEDNAGEHLDDGEIMDSTVIKASAIYNSTKIYENVIPLISTPGGHRAPEANKAIADQIFKGTFMMNYSGHGNTQVLSHERILTQDDYNKWKNLDKLPFIITATCDFGRFDHPDYVSAGEQLVLKADGGVIAAVTTTHLVFAGDNRVLNRDYLFKQFEHINGRWNTFGEALRKGKNLYYIVAKSAQATGHRKFTLLGDPALEPNFPEYFIRTGSVVDGATGITTDSVGALGEYIINGEVTDVNGNILDFDGRVNLSFFDKPRTVETTTAYGKKIFRSQNNVIYRGKATVNEGRFSVTFIAPKDINYEYGNGKVSYYAENGTTDAAGNDNKVTIGGFSDNPRIEYNPPIVKPYIGDSLFRNGGLTGANTLLYVILEDETGINVSGNSIGHDLTAVLDGDIANPYIMNDYYETAPNTYKRGYVNFPVTNLSNGWHRLVVTAWDANNNSGEGYVDFEVADGNVVQLKNLVNYPNPFSNTTHFRFEHNHPDENMDADLYIYNTSGTLVRRLKQSFIPTGSHADEIVWDGTTDNGAQLPSGVYLYKLRIVTDKGIEHTAYQKLVITR